MLIYVFLTLTILIVFRLFGNKKGLIISFVLFALIAALRNTSVGADTILYNYNYTSIGEKQSWAYENSRFEIGFFYLCKVLYVINKDPQTLIFVSSIFINFSFFIFIYKHSNNYFVSSLIYLFGNIYFSNMNIMRQAIAVSILILGYSFLKKKKIISYLIVIGVASLFHDVAWAAIILVLIELLPTKRWNYLLIIFVSLFVFVLYSNFFDLLTSIMGHEEYLDSKYAESNYFGAIFNFVIPLVAVGIPVLYSILNNLDIDKESHKYICTLLVYLCFMGLVIRMNIFNRIAGLFGAYLIIIIPHFLKKIGYFSNNEIDQNISLYNATRDRYIISFITLATYCVSFFIICYSRPEWFNCVPYKFFWQ